MKKIILGFILGLIAAGSITVVVAYNYNAKDIEYTPKDSNWNVNNVEDAIKDLKETKSITIGNSFYDMKAGNLTSRTTSLSLTKGKYIIAVIHSSAWSRPGYVETTDTNEFIPIKCDKEKCSIKQISGHSIHGTSSGTSYGSARATNMIAYSLYYIVLPNDDVVSSEWVTNDANEFRQTFILDAVKVS